MATTINADTTNGLILTADTSGEIEIQADGTAVLKVTGANGALEIPAGTTAQRPSTPTTGAFRYNTTLSYTEIYNGSAWENVNSGLQASDIGVTVQGYDADTAKYDDVTANFTGTLQQGGSNVLTGNQTITLSGDVSGSGTTSIAVTVADDSHNHIISNVDGLQTALDNKQPLDADLTTIAGLSSADGNFIVGSATGWVAESGATARNSLGLGTAATSNTGDFATAAQGSLADSAVQPSDNISTLTNDSGFITGNQTITLSGDLSGSGTTSINAQLGANVVNANELNVTGNGTTSQYLRSDGDGTFTWATPPDTTANQTITLSGDASGSGTTSIAVTVADNSHNHTSANISDATNLNTASTIVKRDASGNFSAGTITAALSGNATTSSSTTGNAATATTWATGRTISLTGDVTGTSGTFNGSANLSFATNIASNVVGAGELNVTGNGTTSQFLRSDGDGSFTWAEPSGGGKILQVVQATDTVARTASQTNNTWYNYSQINASITPSSTSSKILIFVMLGRFRCNSNNTCFTIRRGSSTDILVGAAAGSRPRATMSHTVGGEDNNHASGTFLTAIDSPSTTSSTTYQLYYMGEQGTFYINRNVTYTDSFVSYNANAASTMILMEIGA